MELLERYNEDVFEGYIDEQATKNYCLRMVYGSKGVLVGVNGLFKRLGLKERQKDAGPVLMNFGLRANEDVKELNIEYGVYDYYITMSAAREIISSSADLILAEEVLRQVEEIYEDFMKDENI